MVKMFDDVPTLPMGFEQEYQIQMTADAMRQHGLDDYKAELDEVTIDSYMQILDNRSARDNIGVRVMKVSDSNAWMVTHTIPDDALEKVFGPHKLVLPVYNNRHFSLVVMNIMNGTATHYEPANSNRHEQFVRREVIPKLEAIANIPLAYVRGQAPKQVPQSNECGIFVCGYADFISRCDEEVLNNLSQNQMKKFRPLIAYDLSCGNHGLPITRNPVIPPRDSKGKRRRSSSLSRGSPQKRSFYRG